MTSTSATSRLPLSALRVLDLTEGAAEWCGRILADLGAEVIRIEPPGGSPGRRDQVGFALRNANKAGVAVDLDDPAGRSALLDLAADADILLESFTHAQAQARALTPAALSSANPALVVVSITDFGRTGPHRDRVATEDVLAAAGGVLSRSGLPGGTPLLPPRGVVSLTVGVHAAWAALVAYVKRTRTGAGEHVDVSALEAVVHGFDPGFGSQGSAAAGRSEDFPRGRPDAANFYPIYPCADGHVRVCLLATRQWRAMFSWLGEPPEFADPRYDAIPARFAASDRLNPLIAALFADRARDELIAEGTARGIPIAGVLSVDEVLASDHFTGTGTLVAAEIAEELRATVPSGYTFVDGVRAGLRRRAPEPGEHNHLLTTARSTRPDHDLGLAALPSGAPPLSGLRMLDLGVIVFGAELGRLFADYGADVIKVENSAFPDGLRQTRKGGGMNASFAWGHRNKRGLGLDLRSADGARLFRELVADSDIVSANFKPGTLESLGFSHAELARINPRIVVTDSSAFGSRGPWRSRMGYGPLVRASCGLSSLWRDIDADPHQPSAFCDGSTVYPDHIAGHAAAVAALAAVIGRGATGAGHAIEVPQADVAVYALGPTLASHSSRAPGAGRIDAEGNRRTGVAPAGVFPCAGDDEWCVISVRDDDDWQALAAVTGLPDDPELRDAAERSARRAEIEERLAAWTAGHEAAHIEETLQAVGVPAAAMVRLPEELTHPQLLARDSFHTLAHPLLSRPIPTAARIAAFSTIPDPALRPAPTPGQHTREICASLLRMKPDEIDGLVTAGVLQPPPEDPATAPTHAPIAGQQ
ncbi:CaiB/BaiF CoA transferase family protein [Mycobacterium florentinum]|uniref:CaiB/BaiF CoA transferase family protein n=1 Tax=Mycobacterium florentinum TaxID=292462 RepID=UPI000A1580FA|nr:CoA transferase [Mycobacterium florentinum]MCV7412500.1 CoA transferase [Mycobacterium florentinum]